MSDLSKLSVELNSELESILASSTDNDEVIQYLNSHIRYRLLRRYLAWLGIITATVAILSASIYYIPALNWNASAIGRLVLINCVLPYYNWKPLYNSRCLIERSQEGEQIGKAYTEFTTDDCAVCENLGNLNQKKSIPYGSVKWSILFSDQIDRISNATYGRLQSVYLSRDHPVLIIDSHDIWREPNVDFPDEDANFIDFLLTIPQLRYSIPCNIGTNLLKIRNGSPKLQTLLRQSSKLGSKGWFLHFRNCDFDAVKASRAIIATQNRPYFLSTHLPPFHFSWLLLSQNFETKIAKRLPLNDLAIVLQLSGKLKGRLTVPKECKTICSDLEFKLNAGEALVFNAQLWKFYYHNINLQANLTITFIQEIQTD